MPYTFELTFTGLCVLTYEGDKRKPKRVNLLLAKTASTAQEGHHGTHHSDASHDHVPVFSCWAQDVPGQAEDLRLEPTPTGEQTAQRSIAGQKLTIELPAQAQTGLTLSWRPDANEMAPTEETWLDWLPPLKKVFPHLPDPTHSDNDAYQGLNELKVSTRVILEQGNMIGARFPKDPKTGDYKTWTFKDIHGSDQPPYHIQALSGDLILRVPNLRLFEGGTTTDEVIVRSSANWAVLLKPRSKSRTVVQASITNLPVQDPEEKDYLVHMNMLKELTGWESKYENPKIPVINGGLGVTSGNSFCPPLVYG